MYKTEQSNNDDVGAKNDRVLRSQVVKESDKKDLTEIIHLLDKKREEHLEKQFEKENAISNIPDDQDIFMEPMDTNGSAACQTVESSNEVIESIDLLKEQVSILLIHWED